MLRDELERNTEAVPAVITPPNLANHGAPVIGFHEETTTVAGYCKSGVVVDKCCETFDRTYTHRVHYDDWVTKPDGTQELQHISKDSIQKIKDAHNTC